MVDDDLAAATAFFVALALKLQGEGPVDHSRRRSRSPVGSAPSQPRWRHQETAARTVASSRLQVAGAAAA